MAIDLIARAMAANGGGGGTPTDAYSKTETDALLKNKVGFAEYKDNKISFYNSILKDNIIGEIDLPVDMVVDQIKTKFSQKFKFDETTYPDTENPNLDGKPVLVLAIKTSATADTFSFLNMESLVDVYTGGTTKSAIISVDPETGVITNVVRISAETGNRIVQKDDGLFVPNQSASDVSYSNTTSKLKATTTQAAIDETLNVANEKYSKPSTGIPSTDMAQSVKDSLAKADTALQEADKTELQGEIDDKLDKTAVLSDFSSEDLTNKVPSAQLVLDSFTKKVTTEAVDNDARIITVPENVDCFGSIAMIGGKTVKLNLFDMDEFIKVDPSTITKVNDNSFQVKGAWYKELSITLKASTKYTLSIKVDSSNVQAAVVVMDSSDASVMSESLKVTGSTTFTTTSETSYKIRFYSGNATSGTSVYSNVQLEEGTEVHPYAKFGLVSAPVKKVVLEGKNLFDPKAFCDDEENKKHYVYNNGGIKINSVDTRDYNQFSFSIKVPAGNYSFTGVGSEIRIYDKTSAKQISAEKFTLAVDSEISFKFLGAGSTVYPMLERNSNASPYTPYNKTTINLSDIYGNLEEVFPDYGASAGEVYNYIDFEDGYYHHKVGKVMWKDIASGWGYNTTDKYFYVSGITSKKFGEANFLSPNFTTVSGKSAADLGDKEMKGNYANYNIFLKDNSVTTTSALFAKYPEEYFVYELATEELIPLSSIIPPIHVEPNGTIEFVNEHNLDVPSKTIYKKTV